MKQAKSLPTKITTAERSLKQKGIVQRSWDHLVDISGVAVKHYYNAPWERIDNYPPAP